MNVNEFFNQIGDFWDSISIPIFFHAVFFACYRFIFGQVSIKRRLELYIKSESFARTKAILLEFELWTKLPYLLLVSALIYLSVFNNLAHIIYSSLPFDFSYSNSDFLTEYQNPKDIIEIAKYGRNTQLELWQVDELISRLSAEYKHKYPEEYKLKVDYWENTVFSKRYIIFNLACLTLLVILFTVAKRLLQRNIKGKPLILIRATAICTLWIYALFILRYRAEQAIEEKFVITIHFVRSSLEADSSKQVTYNEQQINLLTRNLAQELSRPIYGRFLWVSRVVGENRVLEYVLGRRVLASVTTVQSHPQKRNSLL